jgi:glycosyltransferase involved in cell wall biosynthesis
MLPAAEPHMRSHGLSRGKFNYVPNGIDPSEWAGGAAAAPGEHRQALESAKAGGRFTVLYAGAHGVANSLHSIVRTAARLRDSEVTFFLVGHGPEKAALQSLAGGLGLSNVVFLPPAPKNAIPALLEMADALIITLQRTPIFRFGISPNKLMDYMMAARPVIQAIEAGNDMVQESGCGISVQPENPEAIADAVLRLMTIPESQRAAMGARGRAYVMARHDYRVLANRFLEALEAA